MKFNGLAQACQLTSTIYGNKVTSAQTKDKTNQMYKKIIKNVLAISWISAVIYFYFQNHSYYGTSMGTLLPYLLYILAIPIIYGCYALNNWINKGEKTLKVKITTPRIIVTALLLILMSGNAVFIIMDPSFYHGTSMFLMPDGTVSEISDLSQLTGQETLIVGSESAFIQTDKTLDAMLEGASTDLVNEITSRFEKPTFWQIQWGLVTKSIGIILILGLITLTAISFGQTILKTIKLDHNTIIALGLGLFSISLGSFLLGSLHILNIYGTWGFFIALLAISYKSLIESCKKIVKFETVYETRIISLELFIIFVLGLVMSMNFIDSISSLPRGWDGMNQYVNIAKRIEEASGLIQMGGNYYWELIMSLGFIMFKWTTITLNLAGFYPATLCAIVLYVIIRKFSSRETALFTISAFYLTPMFLFHGVEDNKVDLGNFLISMITALSVYKGITSENRKEQIKYIAIAGALAGFCFGIKITSLLLVCALATIILYKIIGKKGAIAGLIFSIGALILTKSISITNDFQLGDTTYKIIGLSLLVIGLIMITARFIKEKNLKPLMLPVIFIGLSILAFSPWMIKNYSETLSISTNGLLFGHHSQPTINYELLTEDLAVDKSACVSTGVHEELDRYAGYETNAIKKYVTLPWHLTMNDNGVQGLYVDFGWIPLALLIGFLPFIVIKKPDQSTSIILIFTVTYWITWLITANGIIWYGLPGFMGLLILIGKLIDNYKTAQERETPQYETPPYKLFRFGIIGIIICIFLISSLAFRLNSFGKGALLLYTANIMTETETTTSIFPYGLAVHDIFENDQDGKYDLIWKIGTSLNYFIEDNFWRTYNDQYLDDLNCLYSERDPELLTERLKVFGFGYILFDYYTNTISLDPDGTLNTKYNAALDYFMNYTDIVIMDYFRGQLVAKIRGTTPENEAVPEPAL